MKSTHIFNDLLTLTLGGFMAFMTGCASHPDAADVKPTEASPTGQQSSIPSVFIGKWIETTNRDQQLVVTGDSIAWTRKDEGTESFSADKLKLIDNGRTIAFDATEIAYWNYATGEKPRRPIQVTIKLQAGQLRVILSGGETTAPGPSQNLGLLVTTPQKEYWFKRK